MITSSTLSFGIFLFAIMWFLIMQLFVPCFVLRKKPHKTQLVHRLVFGNHRGDHPPRAKRFTKIQLQSRKNTLYLSYSVLYLSAVELWYLQKVDGSRTGWGGGEEMVPLWLSDLSFSPGGLCCRRAYMPSAYGGKAKRWLMTRHYYVYFVSQCVFVCSCYLNEKYVPQGCLVSCLSLSW